MSYWSIFFVNMTVYPEVLMIICKELLHQNLLFAIGRSNRMTFIICKRIVIQAHFFLNCCKNDKLWKYCCTSPSSMQQEVASGWSVSFAIAIWTRSVLFASGLSIRMIWTSCKNIVVPDILIAERSTWIIPIFCKQCHIEIFYFQQGSPTWTFPKWSLSSLKINCFCLHLHQVWIVLYVMLVNLFLRNEIANA